MAVAVRDRPSFSAGPPRLLFEGPFAEAPCCSGNYDVHPDGERFLMIDPPALDVTRIHIITDWNREVARRVRK